MISSKQNDEILKEINYINSKKTIKKSKFTINDSKINKKEKHKNHKVRSFRMQEEFGPKKHIKP